ncbi:MAG: hypothetical protein H0W33_12785 [Gammaproteobacteria bacterium]|nr:hypothetical protein [Gammaproteobacteria bacterium]
MSNVPGRVADWLTGRRHRAALVAAALAFLPLTYVLSGATVALVTLHGGGREGLIVSAGAALAAGVWVLVLGGNVAGALGYLAILFLPALGLAALLRRTESLTLCLQVAVLAATVLLLGMFAWPGDPIAFWEQVVEQWDLLLRQAGFEMPGFVERVAPFMPGSFAASIMLLMLMCLFVGRWLQAAKTEGLEFGPEFRRLKLGYLIAGAAALTAAGALISGALLLKNLALVLLGACLLQGLSVAHAVRAAKRLSVGWLVLLYVLLGLPTPLLPAATAALIGLGLVDNWIDVREKVNPK